MKTIFYSLSVHTEDTSQQKPFIIPYPILWLCAAGIVIYSPSVFFGLTRLDDYLLVVRLQGYNSHISSLFTAFTRGVFGIDDHYYRPIFIDSILLNSWLFGGKIMGYHIINILLHVLAVVLLYKLFLKLQVSQPQAFILALLFAIHPVLAQAVAWIPGRNDTLLAVFAFAFFIQSIKYTQTGKVISLLLSVFFLLVALFTKEAGIMLVPVALVLLSGILEIPLFFRRIITQFIVWCGCGLFWWIMRHHIYLKNTSVSIKEAAHKLPVLPQYIGKIFFPINLSVFPSLKDTSHIPGIIAVIMLVLAIFLAKNKNWRMVWCGLAVFVAFATPLLFIPGYVSPQVFEHRLYLPIVGILLVLPQTIFFKNNLNERRLFAVFIGLSIVLALVNFRHQQSFANPVTFWSQAVKTSPNSGYAHMMLAMQVQDRAEAHELFKKAAILSPHEQHINYNWALILQKEDSVIESEKYLLTEKNISNYYMCDFYLAKVALKKGNYPAAMDYYRDFVNHNPNYTPQDKAYRLGSPGWAHPDSVKALLNKALTE